MTDPIADLLTRIRNAQHGRKADTVIPHSTFKKAILDVLKKKNFIMGYEEITDEKAKKQLKVSLIMDKPALELKRVSKPGQRIYVGKDAIKKVKSGLGVVILSTSKGVITGEEAKAAGIGGEVLCRIS